MDVPDYYQALGVAQGAEPDAIKKAYRKLARKYHPDVSKETGAEARMKELNEAYGVLSDAEKRAAYDELRLHPPGSAQFRPPPGWNGDGAEDLGDLGDFFANLFGRGGRGAGNGGAGGRRGFQMRGEDQHAALEIDLLDSYRGATIPLGLRSQQRDAQGRISGGERTLNVQIPKGVKEGQQMRLAGQGGAGQGGAPAGDLFLEIHFRPDARYRVEERDVYQQTPVTPWEAALGGAIDVATPGGTVQVGIPAGSQAGRKLRLRGRGIPGEPAGDLYLVLELVLPPADTARAKEIYASMAREMAFNPRAAMGG